MRKLTGIVIGAGSRGRCYSDEMAKSPERFDIVGVAEPVEAKRKYIDFSSWLWYNRYSQGETKRKEEKKWIFNYYSPLSA